MCAAITRNSTVRSGLRRRWLEIAALATLLPVALYLRLAPILAERSLAHAGLPELISAARRYPGDERVAYYLGRRYLDRGDTTNADRELYRAAHLDGSDLDCWIAWAQAEDALDHDGSAQQILTSFVRFHPDQAKAHYALALHYQKRGAHKRAWEEARAAAEREPGNADYWRLSGEEAIRWAQLAYAETAMRKAVDLQPGDWRNQVGLGSALMERGDTQGAAAAFAEAVRIAPGQAAAQLCLARTQILTAAGDADLDRARSRLQEVVRLQPSLAPAYLLIGQTYLRQQQWARALAPLVDAERLARNDPDVAFALSEAYRRTGDQDAAGRAARRHDQLKAYCQQRDSLIVRIAASPDDVGLRLQVARLCAAHGELADARYYYRSILSRAPASPEAISGLSLLDRLAGPIAAPGEGAAAGRPTERAPEPAILARGDALMASKAYKEAAKAYLAVLTADRGSGRAFEGVGLALSGEGRESDAALFLEHAVRLDPSLPRAELAIARRYLAVGLNDEAARRTRIALQGAPQTANAWHLLGDALGDAAPADAEDAYRHAVALDAGNASYQLDLADRQAANGYSQEAEQSYRQALRLAPRSSDALSRLAGFLLSGPQSASRSAEAQKLLGAALQLDPRNDFAEYGLGRLAVLRGDYRGAIRQFRRTTHAEPDVADAWYALSRAYARAGDKSDAASSLAKAARLHEDYLGRVHATELIRLHPDQPELHLRLARLCVDDGERARALYEYRRCTTAAPHDGAARREETAYTAKLSKAGRLPDMKFYTLLLADVGR